MALDVKPRSRSYRSPKRAAQAAETRGSVLSAAHTLFLEKGWVKTTISEIASAAGVSVETVYSTFGSKNALLQELVSRTVRGDSPDKPLVDQEASQRIAGMTDQARQVELFCEDVTKVLARVAPLMDVVRTAAATDPVIARLYVGFHNGRRKNLDWFASVLLQNGPLRGDMDARAAGLIIWRLASPDLFLLVRQVEGGSLQTYMDWLTESLKLQLLTSASAI